MLRKVTDLFGYKIRATDDDIGHVHDFYFDTEDWAMRYLVVDVGSWLFGRRILIAPDALDVPDWNEQVLPVRLTKQQVKESPAVDLAQPVTRAYETSLFGHYGWAPYWGGAATYAGGMGIEPSYVDTGNRAAYGNVPDEVAQALQNQDSYVQSLREMTNYSIEATDGTLGHVADFFVDDEDWQIRYLLIDTGNWWPGKKVLVAPTWVNTVSWDDARIYVELTQEKIKHSPEYDPDVAISRTYERDLHRYYGYPEYW